MAKPTRTDYLAFAKASSDDHQVRITNVTTQDTLFEDRLDQVELNTIYMMTVSRNDYTRSWGYLILINENGEIENALNRFLEEA